MSSVPSGPWRTSWESWVQGGIKLPVCGREGMVPAGLTGKASAGRSCHQKLLVLGCPAAVGLGVPGRRL